MYILRVLLNKHVYNLHFTRVSRSLTQYQASCSLSYTQSCMHCIDVRTHKELTNQAQTPICSYKQTWQCIHSWKLKYVSRRSKTCLQWHKNSLWIPMVPTSTPFRRWRSVWFLESTVCWLIHVIVIANPLWVRPRCPLCDLVITSYFILAQW